MENNDNDQTTWKEVFDFRVENPNCISYTNVCLYVAYVCIETLTFIWLQFLAFYIFSVILSIWIYRNQLVFFCPFCFAISFLFHVFEGAVEKRGTATTWFAHLVVRLHFIDT